MRRSSQHIMERAAAEAFSRQAPLFDKLYQHDSIIRYKRDRVRAHLLKFLKPASRVLELNAGTGEDAIFLARQGHLVHATDISPLMQEVLREKIKSHAVEDSVSTEICSFTNLGNLNDRGPYDCIFSNFAGLNCTDQLKQVLDSFDKLLKPGGIVTLVILPRFCLWELLLVFRGKFRTAFRRFTGRKGAKAHIEGQLFRCWYYNPSFITRHMAGLYSKLALEGLCTVVPPSYIEGFAEKYPSAFKLLEKKEDKLRSRWPFRSIGDYFIITLRKDEC